MKEEKDKENRINNHTGLCGCFKDTIQGVHSNHLNLTGYYNICLMYKGISSHCDFYIHWKNKYLTKGKQSFLFFHLIGQPIN